MFYSRSYLAVIRVYDEAGKVIQTHEHAGDFKEPVESHWSRFLIAGWQMMRPTCHRQFSARSHGAAESRL
jgi:hypothetical protein